MPGAEIKVVPPRYARLPKPNAFSAAFGAGARLSVEAGRKRRYPGLCAPAADTRALYMLAASALGSARRVLDLGCGSGIGSAELAQRFEHVTAVDDDPSAVAFARAYLPELDVQSDIAACTTGAFDAVCIVDVLGQSEAPQEVLQSARELSAGAGRLFVAEPRAYPAQALLAPVQRAYSPRALEKTLMIAGFEVETWLDAGHFVACVARPSPAGELVWLTRGARALSAGRSDEALQHHAELAKSPQAWARALGLVGRADAHRERGELMDACRCLVEALAEDPQNAGARARLAELSLFAGDATEALSLAVTAFEADPCDPIAARALALAAEGTSRMDALATWRIASSLAPHDLLTANELARAAAGAGDLGFAIWVLERLRDFRPDLGADFHVTLSWLYASAGRMGEARLEGELARVKDAEAEGVIELWAHLSSGAAGS